MKISEVTHFLQAHKNGEIIQSILLGKKEKKKGKKEINTKRKVN